MPFDLSDWTFTALFDFDGEGGGGGDTPTSTFGLVGWYDASDEDSLTGSNPLTNWGNKAGNSDYDLPTDDAGVNSGGTDQNDLNCISISGATQPFSVTFDEGAGDYTIFFIYKSFGSTAGKTIWENVNTFKTIARTDEFSDGSTDTAYDEGIIPDAPGILRYEVEVNSGVTLYVNGVEHAAWTNLLTYDLAQLYFFDESAGGSPVDCDVCGILIYTQIPSASETVQIEARESAKWGLYDEATAAMTVDATWTMGASYSTDLSRDHSARIVCTVATTDTGIIFEKGSSTRGLILYAYGGKIYLQCGSGSAYGSDSDTAEISWTITGNQTRVIEYSVDRAGTEIALYVDGTLIGTDTFTGDVSDSGTGGLGETKGSSAAVNRGGWTASGAGDYTGSITGAKIYLGEVTSDVEWTPGDLSSIYEWFSSADTSSITDSSSAVSAFAGQEGAYTYTQSAESNKPMTGTMVNGRNVIVFGDGDYLERSDALGLSGNPAFSVFAVGIPSTPADGEVARVFHLGDIGGGEGIGFEQNRGGFRYNNGNAIFYPGTADGATLIASCWTKSSSATYASGVAYYENNSAINLASSSNGGATPAITDTASYIGGGPFGGMVTDFYQGALSLLVLCDAELSSTERERLFYYSSREWGVGID